MKDNDPINETIVSAVFAICVMVLFAYGIVILTKL